MKYSLLLALLFNFAFGVEDPQKSVALFSDKIDAKNDKGKDLVMELNEVRREKSYSEVVVIRTSGASVPSTMFVVKGMYSIAKLRNSKHFINLKEWDDHQGSYHYIIGFSNDNTTDPKEQFPGNFDPAKDLKFMSVDQFAMIFERK